MAILRQTKYPCVVLYKSQQEFPKLREKKRQNRAPSVAKPAVVELETQ